MIARSARKMNRWIERPDHSGEVQSAVGIYIKEAHSPQLKIFTGSDWESCYR